MAGIVLAGMMLATMGMGAWIFTEPVHSKVYHLDNVWAALYITGQALILLGALAELFVTRQPRRAVGVAPAETARVAVG